DMGRMPAAVDDGNGTLTLAELFSNPGGIGPYEARPASAENLAAGAPPQIADETVLVPCGWGGPYIAPPSAAAQRLRDPWGNPVETPDGAGLARVVATNAEGECRSGEPIAAVRHYGSDGMADSERTPASHEARDCEEALSRSDSAILLTFAPGSISKVCWYAPLGDKITGGSITVGADKSQLRISGMTPGIRFVKIFPASGDAFVRQIPLWPGRDAVLEIADR
ncbi:MAG: hypothetical protein IJS46_02625, partial [Kiritimatiellae bacterium]|nr:hypothetical protein [Kiritimatiellia bacterium]